MITVILIVGGNYIAVISTVVVIFSIVVMSGIAVIGNYIAVISTDVMSTFVFMAGIAVVPAVVVQPHTVLFP
jgi:hypothetical protein